MRPFQRSTACNGGSSNLHISFPRSSCDTDCRALGAPVAAAARMTTVASVEPFCRASVMALAAHTECAGLGFCAGLPSLLPLRRQT